MTDMENAEKLFQEYKVKEAYPLFEKLAGEGNPRAMYFMALFHQYYMECAPWSPKKAIEWALKGARLGDGLCGLFCLLHFNELSHEEYHEITDRREEWISLSQKDGSLYALEALGCYEMVNAQSEEEVDRAFHLLEEAALKNYWKAWNDLGQFHDRHVKDNNPLLKPYIDDKKSISCYRKSMEAGYPDSMNRLAYFYYLGDGMQKDEKEGIRLFKKAFSKGNLKAGTALGMLYLFDEKGGSKKEGFRYTKKAAEGGEPTAMGNLANCYYYGNGTKKDRRLAKEWYGRASDAGMDSSTTQLGVMYHEDGNDDKAFALFKEAAERGFPEAMGWLAACYQYGYGTEVNSLAAVQWLEKAASLGSREAEQALQYLYKEIKGMKS
jgi:TPR repeat protein